MDVYEAVLTRRSVRSYEDRAVEPDKLRRVLEAARLAPSARNDQEWRFVVVTEPEQRRRLAEEGTRHRFIAEAAVIVAACAQTDGRIMRGGAAAARPGRDGIDRSLVFLDDAPMRRVQEGASPPAVPSDGSKISVQMGLRGRR